MELFFLLVIALVSSAFAYDVSNREDFAYQVSLRKEGIHICGGAIYGSRHILTAASCVNGTKSKQLEVVTGNLYSHFSLSENNKTLQLEKVKKITIHRNFSTESPQFNVAILELKEALKIDNFTKTVPIATNWMTLKTCVVSGWGANGTHAIKDILSASNVTKFGNTSTDCRNYNRFLPNVTMCVTDPTGQNPCVDDLGGPLVCNQTLYGLNSWRNWKCDTEVYTNITQFANWIKTNGAATTDTAIWLSVTALLLSVFRL